MNGSAKKATLLGIFGNILLFLLKIIVGFVYNSIAVISDAINSFTDIIASIIVYVSVKVSSKKADKEHPFGHKRAEPIAGLVVAILTGILGFEVIKFAVDRLITGGGVIAGIVPLIVVLFTLTLKSGMYIYTVKIGKKISSIALLASAADHRNDVVISVAVLIGVGGSYFGYPVLDPIVAIVIGFWIIFVGYKIGLDNVKFLIGEAPSDEFLGRIKKIALSIKGVKGLNDVRAHYVGVRVQVEVHIELNKRITLARAHTIGKNVQNQLERLSEVDRAFVHIDPVG